MTLPLHHCRAIGCQMVINPQLHFCQSHVEMISNGIAHLILNSATPEGSERALTLATLEIAIREGHIDDFYKQRSNPPAVSQEEPPTQILPCAAAVPDDAVVKASS